MVSEVRPLCSLLDHMMPYFWEYGEKEVINFLKILFITSDQVDRIITSQPPPMW